MFLQSRICIRENAGTWQIVNRIITSYISVKCAIQKDIRRSSRENRNLNLIELCSSIHIDKQFTIDYWSHVHFVLESLCSKTGSSTLKNTANISSITIVRQRFVILKLISTVLVNIANFMTAMTLKHMLKMTMTIAFFWIKMTKQNNFQKQKNLNCKN